jgi:hypothetical protein
MHGSLELAKRELLRDLDGLASGTHFQVIFYDLETHPLLIANAVGMHPATSANKQAARERILAMTSEGGTNHLQALQRALALRPHVVYYLTDADEFRPAEINQLTSLNHRGSRAIIHCLEMAQDSARAGENNLARLARQNGGSYHRVAVESLAAKFP